MTALPHGFLNDASILSLRCFVAVVETQSFSSAARQLRLVPSSVTKHIQSLESGLNVALVHRTTRRISVTDAGERFYGQCLSILGQIDNAAAVMVSETQIVGHLRVTAPPSFAATLLAPHINAFLERYPGLSVDIIVTSASPDLIRDRIDVAVTLQEEPESKLAHILLSESPRSLCASPGYLEKFGTPETIEELASHSCVAGRFSELAEPWVLKDEGGWQPVHVASRLLSDNGELLRQACIMGSGIGNFYDFHVRDDLSAGRLVKVLRQYEVKSKNVYAVIPHRQIVRPQTRVFLEFMRSLTKTSTRLDTH
jgi:DNA-binding transcriptional LysR family regulator